MSESEVLFFDEETGGKILLEGTTNIIIYPEVDHTKCGIYKKQKMNSIPKY